MRKAMNKRNEQEDVMKNTNLFKKLARATGGLLALGGLCVTTQASAVGLVQGDVIINEWNAVGPENKWLEERRASAPLSTAETGMVAVR